MDNGRYRPAAPALVENRLDQRIARVGEAARAVQLDHSGPGGRKGLDVVNEIAGNSTGNHPFDPQNGSVAAIDFRDNSEVPAVDGIERLSVWAEIGCIAGRRHGESRYRRQDR
jgi:hypothetical protein